MLTKKTKYTSLNSFFSPFKAFTSKLNGNKEYLRNFKYELCSLHHSMYLEIPYEIIIYQENKFRGQNHHYMRIWMSSANMLRFWNVYHRNLLIKLRKTNLIACYRMI